MRYTLNPVHGNFHEMLLEFPPAQSFIDFMNISWKINELFNKFHEFIHKFLEFFHHNFSFMKKIHEI